jgi:pimeloyl-ACP methyl ester carboxylesterase
VQDADDIAALLRELYVPKADVLGFSNGGNTAMQLAIRHPQLVNKLVLASAFYKREGLYADFWEFMKNADLASMPEALKTAYLSLGHNEDELRNMHDRDARRMQQFTDGQDDDLRAITSPTMILSSDRDVVKVEHSLLMSQLIAEATLIILPGLHGEYLGEAGSDQSSSAYPSATIALIEAFLAR